MKLIAYILSAALLMFAASSGAEILVYDFDDPQKEARFNQLTAELRCPKCQNNNLADSDAPLAVDLKDIIYEKLNANESNEQIVGYLTERYGDFITYRPPLKPSTWIIWFGPFVFLLVGGWLILRFVAGRKEKVPAASPAKASKSSQDLIAEWQNEVQQSETREDTKNDDQQGKP
jgi:cytochrome c-type biogenesis protein CcmH